MADTQYVYVMTSFSDEPLVERYELVERLSSGSVRVRCRGNVTVIRTAVQRTFFYALPAVELACRQHVHRRMSAHMAAVTRLQETLTKRVPIHEVPSEPPPRHIILK